MKQSLCKDIGVGMVQKLAIFNCYELKMSLDIGSSNKTLKIQTLQFWEVNTKSNQILVTKNMFLNEI